MNYNQDTSQKNFNADLTNPNVYHCIDENNEEHVYDEIKQMEGFKDPGEQPYTKTLIPIKLIQIERGEARGYIVLSYYLLISQEGFG